MISESLYKAYKDSVSFIEKVPNVSFRNTAVGSVQAKISAEKRDPNFFLKRTEYFLKLLKPLVNVDAFTYIHVTGTAGKGSATRAVAEGLHLSGKKVGLYTSPYATTTIEKIWANGLYISPQDFIKLVNKLKPYIAQASKGTYGAPSAFDICLAISLLYFKQEKCTHVVLEVGLGGRYDSTNFIKKPFITAITKIDYDHTEILGKTLPKIAYDKAGIIKRNSLVVVGEKRPELLRLFKKITKEVGGNWVKVMPAEKVGKSEMPEPNASIISTILNLCNVDRKFITPVIQDSKLPCRFEIMKSSAKKPTIILDGAHSAVKMRSTRERVLKLLRVKEGKLNLVIAVANTNHDIYGALTEIIPFADNVFVTSTKGFERKSTDPYVLEKVVLELKKKNTSVRVFEDPYKALNFATKNSKNEDTVLVSGSFFLVGELRKKWFSEEWVLENRRSF